MMVDFGPTELVFLFALGVAIAVLLARRGKSPAYLIVFALFWLYAIAVFSVILFPIVGPSATNGGVVWPPVNLIPFNFGDCQMAEQCAREVFSNIILTIPAGIFMPLLIQLKQRQWLVAALLVGVLLEALQYGESFAFRSGFRAADINDVILNASGVVIGYLALWLCAWITLGLCQRVSSLGNSWICSGLNRVAARLPIGQGGVQKRA